ncbi:ATP-binding protein [Clostridium aminobutyricum]|uniref:DUF87 domain-containing protein n=1 Tax=Clostridium aminobutyricum TaxID=33953 RepID=A0A939D625_CLOAM|nr:DUF87 domain-containing protein [Clostridium aminobutyricum]MBN7771842.1 DUF87 domain-containing protein [Clostridium aminobutyricum]
MNNEFENLRSRCIGTVDSVSPKEIKGILLDEAPLSVAITDGNISFFPKLNSYLLIPNEAGWVVSIVSWIGYNHLNNKNNETYIDLPQGSRAIYLNPLGQLKRTFERVEFERGLFSFPTVGDSIVLPTQEQLGAIVYNADKNATISIGISPLAGNQEIKLSPDKLFGRHLAVLGNTGSGKSCTVAGIIRWSLEAAKSSIGKSPNARFIILDPNGEYKNAFNDLDVDIKYSCVNLDKNDQKNINKKQLRIPGWLWTSQEWAGVLQASGKTQKPILREALRDLKASNDEATTVTNMQNIDMTIKTYLYKLLCFAKRANASQEYIVDKTNFGKTLNKHYENINYFISKLASDQDGIKDLLTSLNTKIEQQLKSNKKSFNKSGENVEYYDAFSLAFIDDLITTLAELIKKLGGLDECYTVNEDMPVEFDLQYLAPYMDLISQDTNSEQYIEFIIMRIKSLLNNTTISSVIGNQSGETLLGWINDFVSNQSSSKGQICIIDLSIVPLDIIHLVVSVISRLIFESLQRYRRYYSQELPTILVMEEAHTFIRKYTESTEEFSADKLCTHIFERIAREGRKFGLGLVLSSQRPSELSQTVLSQCNSYILHRIVNDRDQELIRKLVPDNLGNLLDELPSLPTQKAIVLGTSVPLPTVVEIRELSLGKRPNSDDPAFWDVWTNKETRDLNWKPIVDEWQNKE